MSWRSIGQPVVITPEIALRLAENYEEWDQKRIPRGVRLTHCHEGDCWTVEHTEPQADETTLDKDRANEFRVDVEITLYTNLIVRATDAKEALDAVVATWANERPSRIEAIVSSAWAEVCRPGETSNRSLAWADFPLRADEGRRRYAIVELGTDVQN